MENKQIVTGIVGVVVGFILGFFVSLVVNQPQSASSPATGKAGESSQMPENHPPPEVMEQVRQLLAQTEKEPQNKEVRITLGNIYYDMGRFDAAITWYEQALALDQSNVNVRTDLGTSYLYTGNAGKAIEMYQKSLEIQPDHPQTLQNLGFAFFAAERFADAIQSWEKLLKEHPDYPHKEDIQKQIQDARSRLKKQS
ncbi:MAG: tetratricopeptide repeat protein [Acidobacteria bacterium]|nr:tetratricopeptide repeat protein [Acidobacteriota bacterium]